MNKNRIEMQNYEMMIVLKPLLPDDVRKVIHKDILEMVKESEGELLDVDVWGKRYLAFDIKGHNEGYYIVYNFKLKRSDILEFKRKLSLKSEILRFMVVVPEHPELIGKSLKKKVMDLEV